MFDYYNKFSNRCSIIKMGFYNLEIVQRRCATRVNPIPRSRETSFLEELRKRDAKLPLAFLLGTATGLRISDLLLLKAGDIYRFPYEITEQKTGKKRRIDPPEALSGELHDYCHLHRLKNNEPLWPFTRQYVYRAYKAAGDAVGIQHVGTHSMRKTYVCRAVEGGRSLPELQQDLGHHYVSTTVLYCLSASGEWAAVKG